MTIQVSVLDNGMRVVSHRMPHLETVSLGVWVATGARHEAAHENGISHLLEHMAFKGTMRRDARRIAEEIEQVGGELNAATSAEMTAYYARILKPDVELAIDILADILQNSRFVKDELEREREVILQEIAATRDSPEEIAFDLLHEAAFPDQALGRPILGSEESVSRFTGEDLVRFQTGRYRAGDLVLSAAGAVDHDQVVKCAAALFSGLPAGKAEAGTVARYHGGQRTFEKSFEQSHLVLAFEAPSYRSRDFYAAQVYSGVLGGGMSSRLFQEVRERQGLCYSIYSSCWGLSDTGVFGVHSATSAEQMPKLIDVVIDQIERSANDGAKAAEVARAKAQIKAGLLMGLESSSGRAEQMARQLLAFDRLLTTEEMIERVEAVRESDVRDMASRLVSGSDATVIVVGAGRRTRQCMASLGRLAAMRSPGRGIGTSA
ncbi:MAG: M16 family metallopeptidase [Hyphomicrobiaceae bacterium]